MRYKNDIFNDYLVRCYPIHFTMKKYALFLLAACMFIACGDNQVDISKINVDPGFSNYVNAFTSGVISKSENVKVVLFQPFAEAKAGEPLQKRLFSFEPEIEGQAYWVDNQTIEFRPHEKLQSGKAYKATFFLGEVMEVPSEYEEMEFGFMVMHQSLFVQFQGIRTTDMQDFSRQEVFGSVRTNDIVQTAELEKCFKATQEGKPLSIVWSHDQRANTHVYTIANVIRGEDESEVLLEWDGEHIGVDQQDEKEIRIPPLGEFSVIQISTLREPGLHFSIQFSDPLDPNQDLNGLVYLSSGRKLRLSVVANEVKAYPVGKLSSQETIIVNQRVMNIRGNELKEEFQKVAQFNLEKPAIELLGEGVIMPSNGELSFPFKAINLKAVNLRILRIYENNITQFFQSNQHNGSSNLSRVGKVIYDDVVDLLAAEPVDYGVWTNFNIDLSKLIELEPGAIYRVMMSFERYQSLYPCGDSSGVVKPMKRRKLNFESGAHYFDADGWFEGYANYQERDNPCTDSYYKYYERHVSKNVLASNFGIIAKEGANNHYDVVVTDLRTTDPVDDVTIEAYDYQNQFMASANTNGDGLVQLITDGKPYLLMAKKGNQRGYLRVDNGSSLSMSLFEVGGAEIKEGIKGYIYGERGVWRPGDSLFLSFVLEDKLNKLPASHPIIMELYDPRGKLFDKKVSNSGVKGLYSFKFKTNDKSPTGKWRVKAIVGNSEFVKSLKVETIKPNRIKIDLDFPDVISSTDAIKTSLSAKWLYGSPGAGLKAKVKMNVENMRTEFDGYEGYAFDDRSKQFYGIQTIESEGTTNAEGNVRLSFSWNKPNKAPGMLKMKFNTQVFEKGGDFSQDFLSKKYSPYQSYVGLKLPGGENWRTALNTEEKHAVMIAAVDENGRPINRNVKVELYRVTGNWWWEGNGGDELTRYISRSSAKLLQTHAVNVANGKSTYNLSFPEKGWGKYLLRVIDQASGHSAMHEFYGEYPGWYNNMEGNTEAASILSLEADKANYNVGEEVQITMPSGGIGKVYVTVEKGDQVLDRFWVDAQEGSTKFSIPTRKEMAPNVYVSAFLIQPHAQEENSLPIRMYGVIPVKITDPTTHLQPLISCPNEIQPESSFTVKVKEKTGKGMAYTLAVVDEGLLSLTRFKTPNPWNAFYAKEALGIRNWDMYKYVMSAQTGKMTALYAIGGDEGLVYKEDAKANRFKSVVSYLGPFYLDKGKEQSHTIQIPNYIGAVRVMVVGVHEGAYGKAEKEVQVKQPLMVLSTLPRVLGPSEKVTIPVNVITMNDRIKNVKVNITTNDLLIVNGSKSQTVQFDKAGEKTVYFEYEVPRKLGVAKFKAEVSAGTETAFEELEILVRPANPPIQKSKMVVVEPGTSWTHNYEAFGIKGTNEAVLQISKIPSMDLEKQLSYLIRYPHGCIEQTTSAVFPQLYLSSFTNLSDEQEEAVKKNIMAALNKFRSFQNAKGGFNYWPSSTYSASEWGTNYAGHFMLEAKNKGYDLPAGMLEAWVKFQKGAAQEWARSNYFNWGRYQGDLAQAYRLYTLALAGQPDLGSMNRLKKDPSLSNVAAWRLAAAYAVAGREDAAKELTTRNYTVEPYRDMGYCYGSDIRDRAMVLETMTYLNDRQRAGEMVREIAADLTSGWHSTQTRAYALLAIGKFIGADEDADEFEFNVLANDKKVEVNSEVPVYSIPIDQDNLQTGRVNVENKSNQPIFVSFVQSGMPIEEGVQAGEKDLTMSVNYTDLNGNAIDVQRLQQGQDFKAVVRVSHPGFKGTYNEVALNQLFPSGWQIINTRVGDDDRGNPNLDYQDFRDDRVYSYFKLQKGKSVTIEVLLNATFLGRYYQPAVFCAPMYDESIYSMKAGRWVEVVR
jgi:hypothetical protein